MAKPYSQLKVNELKDILRGRGLSLNGTKSELIARLTENDDSTPQSETAAETASGTEELASATAPELAPTAEEPKIADVETPTKPAVAVDSEISVPAESITESTEKKPEEPSEEVGEHTVSLQLSDDELLKQITEDLEKQIKRIERFGGDAAPLQDRLRRINRFGISAVRDAAVKSANPREKKRMRRPKDIKKTAPKSASA